MYHGYLNNAAYMTLHAVGVLLLFSFVWRSIMALVNYLNKETWKIEAWTAAKYLIVGTGIFTLPWVLIYFKL